MFSEFYYDFKNLKQKKDVDFFKEFTSIIDKV